MKIIYIDIETTGTNIQTCAIHQLSGIVVINGEVKEEFDIRAKPFADCEIDSKALEVSGINREDLNNYQSSFEAYVKFKAALSRHVNKYDRLDKFFFAGYNCAAFDMPFVRKFFERCGDKYFGSLFWSVSLDVMILAGEHLKHERRGMPDFKLKTVAEKLGIEVVETKLHDALYDIRLTMQVYEKVAPKHKTVTI